MGLKKDAGKGLVSIFIEGIAQGGAAHRDGRFRVYDQIIEVRWYWQSRAVSQSLLYQYQVDSTRLVGVTYAYAESVLKNKCGVIQLAIGREKDPENSEVAQLIRRQVSFDLTLYSI